MRWTLFFASAILVIYLLPVCKSWSNMPSPPSGTNTRSGRSKGSKESKSDSSRSKGPSHSSSDSSKSKGPSHSSSDSSKSKGPSHSSSDSSKHHRPSHSSSDSSKHHRPSHSSSRSNRPQRPSHSSSRSNRPQRPSHSRSHGSHSHSRGGKSREPCICEKYRNLSFRDLPWDNPHVLGCLTSMWRKFENGSGICSPPAGPEPIAPVKLPCHGYYGDGKQYKHNKACTVCHGANSEIECFLYGKIQECQYWEDACILEEVEIMSGVTKFYRRCGSTCNCFKIGAKVCDKSGCLFEEVY